MKYDNGLINSLKSAEYGEKALQYEIDGKTGLAIEYYTKAIEFLESSGQEYYNRHTCDFLLARGRCYEDQDNLQEAVRDYRKISELYPNFVYSILPRKTISERINELELELEL